VERPEERLWRVRSQEGAAAAVLIDREGQWHNVRDVALATMEWVSWYNNHRLHSWCGNIPPKEFEENYYALPVTLVA